MKILYICHRFPFPPKRGGKIRPFNMISHLAKTHQVTVASLVRSVEEGKEGEGLSEHCFKYIMVRVNKFAAMLRMILRLPSLVPSTMGFFYSPDIARRIRKELDENDFDLIFVHCSSVAQYVEDVKGIPKILDFGDMDSQKWLEYAKVRSFPLTLGYKLEGMKMERAEKRLARKFDYCSCTTRAEMETLQGYNVGCRTSWFPNGVDYNNFCPGDEPYEPDTICFIGRMDYFPNQQCMFDFCKNTLPLIQARRPGVKLTIIGANPSPAVYKLAELPGVTVTGSVPDVKPYVQVSAVNVAPLSIARGTQNKILESLAMGVPVVSSVAAAGGIDAVVDEHFLTATTPEEYADQIIRVLSDKEERSRLSKAGRARMLSNHDWSASMKRLDALIEDCMSLN